MYDVVGLIFLAICFAAYGVVLNLLMRRSIGGGVALWGAVTAVLLLCMHNRVGYVGGSDAMGNGMEAGFLQLFYLILLVITTIISLIVFARRLYLRRRK